jgi:hypothetical protein
MSGMDINEVTKILEDHERRISALEGMPEKLRSEGKKLSVKEFMLTKNPIDDVQKTLVIGYYLEHFEGMDKFNTKDLAEGFRLAREPLPTNINDKVNKNIEKARMMAAREKKENYKAWVLTNAGEKFVEEVLETEGK